MYDDDDDDEDDDYINEEDEDMPYERGTIPTQEVADRVRQLLDTIELRRLPFDMDLWMGDRQKVEKEINFCGTPACLAGQAVTNDPFLGPLLFRDPERRVLTVGDLQSLPAEHPVRKMELTGLSDPLSNTHVVFLDFPSWGGALLGLDESQRKRLFSTLAWPRQFDEEYVKAGNSLERLAATRRRVEHWALTGE